MVNVILYEISAFETGYVAGWLINGLCYNNKKDLLGDQMRRLLVMLIVLSAIINMPLFNQFVLLTDDGEKVYSSSVSDEMHINMEWVHSVELAPWIERFAIKDGNLVLESTSFKAFGAGVPDTEYDEILIEDDWITYPHINRSMEDVSYHVSALAKHQVRINGELIPLYQRYDDETVTLKVEKQSLMEWFGDLYDIRFNH